MWGRGEGNFLQKVSLSPPPRPLLSPFQDFRLYRIPHPGLSSFVGTGLICLSARLVRLALVPPTAVNVTGILRARGIDARRTRHKSHAQPCLWPVWEHPKDEHEKAAALCTKTRKNAVASPLKAIFPPGEGAPRKKRNNFSFRFFASLFCVHHDSFFTIKIYFSYASCSFSQKIMLFQ